MSTNWNFEECPIVNPNEEHMAALFLCDISGSMTLQVEQKSRRIDLLNDALSSFPSAVCIDPKSARTLEVGIIAFDHDQLIVQPFTPVSQMLEMNYKPLHSTGGGTKIAAAANFAVDMLDSHVKHLRDGNGVAVRKPWILMITDGRPEHDTAEELANAISRVKDMEEKGKLRFWSFGVGDFDSETLKRLSGERAFALQGYNFSAMIDWVAKSMRAISVAAAGASPPAPINQLQGMQQILQLPS